MGNQSSNKAITTEVVAVAADTLLLASSPGRNGGSIYNDGDDVLYLKYGSGASSTSYKTQVDPGVLWVIPIPIYTGAIYGRWGAAISTGSAHISEEF